MVVGGLFKKIKEPWLRAALEVIVSSLPGAIILAFFILLIGVLNIFFNISEANDLFIFLYVPVVCILPLIVGILAPLILEKIQDSSSFNLKLSIIVAFLSSFVGSFLASFLLLIVGFSLQDFKPFGLSIQTLIPHPFGLFVASFILVFSSVILALLACVFFVFFINKMEK
jgi:hypothetical protein